jgi:hypothetical protein
MVLLVNRVGKLNSFSEDSFLDGHYDDGHWEFMFCTPPYFLSLVFLLMLGSTVLAQGTSRATVSFNSHDTVFIGVNNYFRVAVQGEDSLSLHQLRVSWVPSANINPEDGDVLEIYRSNSGFIVRPTEPGIIDITISLLDGSRENYRYRAKPLTVTARIGGWDFRSQGKILTNVFKAQAGIYTQIQGFDISGGCNVLGYELIRVPQGKDAEVVVNQGGAWELPAATLIQMAKPGDRYIFTKIRYRCPGAQVDQFAEALSFELK